GRPKGSPNKATIAVERLLQGHAEALIQTAVTLKHWQVTASPLGYVWSVLPLPQRISLFRLAYLRFTRLWTHL
ncbi:MAG: hypothetical protein EBX20_10015, partial [Rhodobacterales bacterium]|nr:hypothetical protein [Rhodobacterales bacterium]